MSEDKRQASSIASVAAARAKLGVEAINREIGELFAPPAGYVVDGHVWCEVDDDPGHCVVCHATDRAAPCKR